MAVPKKRTAKSKRNMRRSHHGMTPATFVACANCGTLIPGHTACPNCGMYRGRVVIDVARAAAKAAKQTKAKAGRT